MRQINESIRATFAAGFVLGSLAACDLPEAPEWDIGTTAPMSSDTFTWIDFLPSTIDTATVGGRKVFVFDIPEDSLLYRLGRVCPPCIALHGDTVQVPPFDFADSLDLRFRENLVAIGVQQATLSAGVDNGFNFDLVGPPSPIDTLPTLTLVLRDLASGETLDSLSLRSGVDSLPPGSRWSPALSISESEVVDGVRLIVRLMYPGGTRVVEIDTMRVAALVAKLNVVQVAYVTLLLDGARWEDDDPVWLDPQTREEIVERFQDGELAAVVNHDLEATGNLEISIAATRAQLFSGDPLNELRFADLVVTSGLVQTIELTQGQLEQIVTFPEPFYVGYRGVADGTRTGPVGRDKLSRLTPDQFVQWSLRLRTRLRVGG